MDQSQALKVALDAIRLGFKVQTRRGIKANEYTVEVAYDVQSELAPVADVIQSMSHWRNFKIGYNRGRRAREGRA